MKGNSINLVIYNLQQANQNVKTIQHYDLHDPVPGNEGINYLMYFS